MKRFKLWRTEDRDGYTDEWAVIDTFTGKAIDEEEVVGLLNKQDCLIKAYELDLDKANSRMSDLNGQIRALYRENEQLKKCLMER